MRSGRSLIKESNSLFLQSILTGLILLSLTEGVFADAIFLKSGQKVEGVILKQTEESVTLSTSIGLQIKYYKDEISRIELSSLQAQNEIIESVPALLPKPVIEPELDVKTKPEPQKSQIKTFGSETDRIMAQYDRELNVHSGVPPLTISKDTSVSTQLNERLRVIKEKLKILLQSVNEKYPHMVEKIPFYDDTINLLENKEVSFFIFKVLPVFHVLIAFPLMILALKCNTRGVWMAWIPFLNGLLFVRIAKKPALYFVLLLIPVLNIVPYFFCWMEIFYRLKYSRWFALIMLVPGANILVLWYIALVRNIN